MSLVGFAQVDWNVTGVEKNGGRFVADVYS